MIVADVANMVSRWWVGDPLRKPHFPRRETDLSRIGIRAWLVSSVIFGLAAAVFAWQKPFTFWLAVLFVQAGAVVLFSVLCCAWWFWRSKAGMAEQPAYLQIKSRSRAYLIWFMGHNLVWATAATLAVFVLLGLVGPKLWVVLLCSGSAACVFGSLGGCVFVKWPDTLALCWHSAVPAGVRGLFARAESTVALRDRYEAAVKRDLASREPLLPVMSGLLDREDSHAHLNLDLAKITIPYQREIAHRAGVFGVLFAATVVLALPLLLIFSRDLNSFPPGHYLAGQARAGLLSQKDQPHEKKAPQSSNSQVKGAGEEKNSDSNANGNSGDGGTGNGGPAGEDGAGGANSPDGGSDTRASSHSQKNQAGRGKENRGTQSSGQQRANNDKANKDRPGQAQNKPQNSSGSSQKDGQSRQQGTVKQSDPTSQSPGTRSNQAEARPGDAKTPTRNQPPPTKIEQRAGNEAGQPPQAKAKKTEPSQTTGGGVGKSKSQRKDAPRDTPRNASISRPLPPPPGSAETMLTLDVPPLLQGFGRQSRGGKPESIHSPGSHPTEAGEQTGQPAGTPELSSQPLPNWILTLMAPP